MSQPARQPDEIERDIDAPALTAIERAGIDQQISTAHKFPRSVEKFQRDALSLATVDQETARSCFYVLPRGGKKIEGASVRLAEIAASSWHNLHVATRVVAEDEKFVTAQAVVWDLETNVKLGCEVQRRITNSYGQRYNDDMITVTKNAAAAIAFRNAIFKVVPAALIRRIFNECKAVSLGKGKTLEEKRKALLAAFMKETGAKIAEILRVCGKRSEGDIDIDDLVTLNGLYTAIKDGDTTWAEVLKDQPKTDEEVMAGARTVQGEVVNDLPGGKDDRMLSEADRTELKARAEALGGFSARELDKIAKEVGAVDFIGLKVEHRDAFIAKLQEAAQ